MHINPVRSLAAQRLPAGMANDSRGTAERVRPCDAETSRGVPMVRVIEGELLDKNSAAVAFDSARRWVLNSATRQGATDNPDLSGRRSLLAIGAYRDTAFMSWPRSEAGAGLDLYA